MTLVSLRLYYTQSAASSVPFSLSLLSLSEKNLHLGKEICLIKYFFYATTFWASATTKLALSLGGTAEQKKVLERRTFHFDP